MPQALSVLPITTDYSVAKMFLQSINTDIVSSKELRWTNHQV
jgi:Ca-activated chloride channel family protein